MPGTEVFPFQFGMAYCQFPLLFGCLVVLSVFGALKFSSF